MYIVAMIHIQWYLRLFSNISGFTECAIIILCNILLVPDLHAGMCKEEEENTQRSKKERMAINAATVTTTNIIANN